MTTKLQGIEGLKAKGKPAPGADEVRLVAEPTKAPDHLEGFRVDLVVRDLVRGYDLGVRGQSVENVS